MVEPMATTAADRPAAASGRPPEHASGSHRRPARPASPGPTRHLAPRALTLVLALATAVSALLLVFRPVQPIRITVVFGLLNLPVAGTFASVVLLALMTRILLGRKRIGLAAVAAFQVTGIYVGLAELFPAARLPFAEVWSSRGDLGGTLDVAAMVIGVGALWWLWRLRPAFTARVQPGSWWAALAALVVGGAVTYGVTWLLLGASGAQANVVVATVVAAFGGVSRHALGVPRYVVDVAAILTGATILGATVLFLASSRRTSRWTPDREVRLRLLLAEHGESDSLGYFATRRDKASVFSADGRAAVTYRVVNGVSVASADPLGAGESWGGAIAAWLSEAREFGWVPAVLSASEAGAKAYAAAGLRVVLMGDEAILDPARFDLRRGSMAPVRHAVKRARRAGVSVRVRRQDELTPEERTVMASRAEQWRGGERERGFSMALGRSGDPADGRMLVVTAHLADGGIIGLLSFVPWGRGGVSLDLMRRASTAPNGVTELMISELMARSRQLGIRRVSLNFCMFRGVFADSARLGARPLVRLNASVLGVLDRFWQLERLYRSNAKLEPAWVPRFLCYEDVVSLPQVLVAAGAVEGFLPWPGGRHAAGARLGADDLLRLQQAAAAAEAAADATSTEQRRRGEFGHRLARLEAMRAEGLDPYPSGGGDPVTSVGELAVRLGALHPSPGDVPSVSGPAGGVPRESAGAVSLVGRVRSVRDHGAVLFATLVDGGASVQLVLDPATARSRRVVTDFSRFVDRGDLVRVEGRIGVSRNGTPSLLVWTWRTEAKCLHPIPFGELTDPDARLRQRSADLIVHPGVVDLFRARSTVLASIRRTLLERGYTEVETPMLNLVHGGATARPFRTFSNAYGVDLSLRIAPELQLKRLLVGGTGPIFELGRNFRNEGADATHNPEFTSLEVYRPHADYSDMRMLAETLIKGAARSLHGRQVLPAPRPDQLRNGMDGVELTDVSGPWPVVRVLHAVSTAVGREVGLDTDPDVLLGLARRLGVEVRPDLGAGGVIEALYEALVEPRTSGPTFFVDFPRETSPLTRSHRTQPGLVERWDLVIGGMEVGTAYSELTDPLQQRRRLVEQSTRAAAGDPEAMVVDADFLHALESGMPPSGGLGLGVDRLVMLLTNTSIRDVLTFPFVRPLQRPGDRTPRTT